MKKILMTASTESHFVNFHKEYFVVLEKCEIPVDLAYPNPTTLFSGVKNQFHIPFQKKYLSIQNLIAVIQLRKIIRENQYTTIITHTTLAAFFTRLTLFLYKNPPTVICVVHGYLFTENSSLIRKIIFLTAEKLLSKKTNLILTMNNWDTEIAKKYKLAEKIKSISGMGVHCLTVTDNHKELFKEKHQLPIDKFLIAYGAEFSKRKNHKFLLRASKELEDDFYFVFAGYGKTQTSCIEFVKKYKLENRVCFLGQISDLQTLYSCADLVVSSSKSEGLPFHLMEAMSLGTPILASKIKGHVDLVQDDYNGFLYPEEDVENFIYTLKKIRLNPEYAMRVGQNASKDFKEKYGISKVLPIVIDYYLE